MTVADDVGRLELKRKTGERVVIGTNPRVVVTVMYAHHDHCKLEFAAPRSVRIWREEADARAAAERNGGGT